MNEFVLENACREQVRRCTLTARPVRVRRYCRALPRRRHKNLGRKP